MSKLYWKSATSGDFTTSADWTPFGPPGALDQAMLTATGAAYTVTVTSNQTVLTIATSANATLELANSGVVFTAEDGTGNGANNGTILLGNGMIFAVAGTINNNGTIELAATGSQSSIFLLGDTTLHGGALTLIGVSSGNSIKGSGTLTNTGNSDISGAGFIEVAVNNKATTLLSGNIIPVIDGNSNSNALELDGIVTNTGELRSDGAAGLIIANTVFNTGGLIDAESGLLQITSGADIVGGTLQNNGGTFDIVDASLDGGGTHPITLAGDIFVGNSGTLFVQGAFKNPNGTLDLQGGASLLLGFSNVAGIDTTFTGRDQIVLNNAGIDLNPATHVGSTPLKLNNVDEIIIGTGTVGNAATPGSFVLNNEVKGVVEALNGELTIYSNVTNAGVLDATGGTLDLVDNVVTNTGSLKAETGANIFLGNTTIRGGTLTGAGEIDADDAVLDGSTTALTNAGHIDVQSALADESRTLTLKGMINNTGLMELFPAGHARHLGTWLHLGRLILCSSPRRQQTYLSPGTREADCRRVLFVE